MLYDPSRFSATYRLEPLVFPSSFMLDSPWFEGWGVDFRAVSGTYRFGISVPDEDPPGNQVTPRVEVAPSLMGGDGLP